MPKYLSLGACAFAALGFQANDASAQDSNCPLDIGDRRVEGNLQIAAPCELNGTEVRGNVTLYAGGSLVARDVRIRGNLEGSRADFVDMDRSRIDGDIRLEELVGDLSSIELTEIRGNLLLENNRSRVEILNNDIRGDMQAVGNTGGVLIAGNTIDEDLECAANTPTPFGVGNRVDEDTEGQCEDLQAEPPQSAPAPPPPITPPPGTPPPSTPPPATPPPQSTPAPVGPAPPAAAPTTSFVPDPEGGGGGAMGWPAALLLPLLVWRRFSRR